MPPKKRKVPNTESNLQDDPLSEEEVARREEEEDRRKEMEKEEEKRLKKQEEADDLARRLKGARKEADQIRDGVPNESEDDEYEEEETRRQRARDDNFTQNPILLPHYCIVQCSIMTQTNYI